MRRRKLISVALLGLAGAVVGAPAPVDAVVSDAVIIALNSIDVSKDADVTGDVVVNDAAILPTLEPGFELHITKNALLRDAARADSIDLENDATVIGAVECNDGVGVACSGLALPVFTSLPPFRAATPGPGGGANCDPGSDCFVDGGATVTLAAGAYGAITIAENGTLVLAGGGYDVASLEEGSAGGKCDKGAPVCRSVEFQATSQLRVAGRFALAKHSFVGPQAGSGIGAADILIYVGGGNGDPSDPGEKPLAATTGGDSEIAANFYVPNGTFELVKNSTFTGSVIARDVLIGGATTLVLASAFNLAPTADPLTVITSGGAADFNLTASDPDGDSLTFTLVNGPSVGTLGGLPASDTASVAVSYTGGTDGVADQFVFRVDDGKGGTDNAVVDINPSDDPLDPPPVAGILAKDDEAEVTQGAVDVSVTLVAAAPIAPQPDPIGDLTFAITSAPDQGGSVTTPVSNPETPVRSASVEYTPLASFTGTETFGFQACEAADPGNCDQATITVDVQTFTPPAPPVAVPQEVTTTAGTEIEINLAVPIGAEEPTGDSGREGCGNGRLDPGEECDDGNLLNGDGCDDQCNSEGP